MSEESIGVYRCIRRLGAGGQATAWLAKKPDTDTEVLVKTFHVELAEDWKIAELFERSAEVLESIDHPNVPAYHDHFELEDGHTVKLCLVREFVEGDSLQDEIDAGGSFSEGEVLDVAIELLEVLHYLHSMVPPVIHRDIKPANIIMSPEGRPYLVDFGAVQAEVMSETGGSTVVGTAGYVAPEQLMGRAQPSSDIYALGVTLVHLLTRKAPTELPSNGFELDFADELHASSELKYVLGRMTKADVDEREDTAAGLLEKFQTLAEGGQIVVRSSTLPTRVPEGSQLEVVEHGNSVIVRTPLVLTWNSIPWKRRLKLAPVALYMFVFLVFSALYSPALGAGFLGVIILVYLMLRRFSRPVSVELGPDYLEITQPLIRAHQETDTYLANSNEWVPFIRNARTKIPYDEIYEVDFAPVETGEYSNVGRVMRLNCTKNVSPVTARIGSLLKVSESDSYLLKLGLTQGEDIWLTRLINARLAQHREIDG